MAQDAAKNSKFSLVESDQRKAAFLRAVARETEAQFEVIAQRIEDIPLQVCDVISARALARLDVLVGHAALHLGKGGEALFLKGQKHKEEIEVARKSWQFRCEVIESLTDSKAVVLKIGEIQRA